VKRLISICGLVAALLLGSLGAAHAQDDAATKQQEAAEAAAKKQQEISDAAAARAQAAREDLQRLVPLSVDVTVTRYQGEKKVSSTPYSLAVNANKVGQGGTSQLRMGANVPVPSIAAPIGNPAGPAGPMPGPVNYQNIGTSIDCSATRLDDGFQVKISVDDTSVYTDIQDKSTPTVGNMPVFRSFKSTNTLVMKDGQSREFTAATDRVSGEVIRVTVTLKVVK